MKFFSIQRIAFLLLFFQVSKLTVLSVRTNENEISQKLESLTKSLKNIQKSSSTKRTARQRKLEQQSGVSSVQRPKNEARTQSKIYGAEELSKGIEKYGHLAWESSNDLDSLINQANKESPDNKVVKATVTQEEEKKIKEAIEYLSKANSKLKYFIDHQILTEEVIKHYEEWLEEKPEQVNNMNGMLVFMMEESKTITLRKHELEFFDQVKMYNSVIKNKFIPIFFLPTSNKFVHALQIKLLNAQRLILFIKKYFFFILNTKSNFHFLDYEKPSNLFRESENDDSYGRLKVVSKKDYKIIKENRKKNNKGAIPLTIIVGNTQRGAKIPTETQKASDFIQDDKQMTFDQMKQTTLVHESSEKTIIVPDGNDRVLNHDKKSANNQNHPLTNSNAQLKQNNNFKSSDNLSSFFENPKESEKNEFIKKKMNEFGENFGANESRQNQKIIGNNNIKTKLDLNNQFDDKNAANSFEDSKVQIIQKNNGMGQILNQSNNERKTPLQDKNSNQQKVSYNQQSFVDVSLQNPVRLDRDGIPTNVLILKVPEILKVDQKYEDPYRKEGRTSTSLSSKVEGVDGKSVNEIIQSHHSELRPDESIPQKRIVYHPNEVNGGLRSAPEGPVDEDLSEFDRAFNDNEDSKPRKLNKIDAAFGSKNSRKLWDQDFGEVYSKIMNKSII